MESGEVDNIFSDDTGFCVHIGHVTFKGSRGWDSHYHDELEFQFVVQGRGLFFVRDRTYDVQRNSVLVIPKYQVHNYVPHPECSHLERVSLIFAANVMPEYSAAQDILERLGSCDIITLSEKEATAAEFCLREVEEELRIHGSYWREIVCVNLEKLLFMFHRAQDRGDIRESLESPLVKEIIAYIGSHLSERLTADQIARRFHISRFYLTRVFKKFLGYGFREYIINRRIVEAKRLLVETDFKIAAVGRGVGIPDISSFNRDFKRLTGITPSMYRELALKC